MNVDLHDGPDHDETKANMSSGRVSFMPDAGPSNSGTTPSHQINKKRSEYFPDLAGVDEAQAQRRYSSSSSSDSESSGSSSSQSSHYHVRIPHKSSTENVFSITTAAKTAVSLANHSRTTTEERLEWSGFLSSVLQGEVLWGEQQRLGTVSMSIAESRDVLVSELWLVARARLRSRTVKQERELVIERRGELGDDIIRQIVQFSCNYKGVSWKPILNLQTSEDSSAIVTAAREEINNLLRRWEYLVSLYPTRAKLAADKPAAATPEFVSRLDALRGWSNVLNSLRAHMEILRTWTRSPTLNVTEKLVQAGNKNFADNTEEISFIERIMKEQSLQTTFDLPMLKTIDLVLVQAKELFNNHAAALDAANIPSFRDELVPLLRFPIDLIVEVLKSRLTYGKKIHDMTLANIEQLLEDLKASIVLACRVKHKYKDLVQVRPPSQIAFEYSDQSVTNVMGPTDSRPSSFYEEITREEEERKEKDLKWAVPECLSTSFNAEMINALDYFFDLLYAKIRLQHISTVALSSSIQGPIAATASGKETQMLEDEFDFFKPLMVDIEGGDELLAKHCGSLATRILSRLVVYFENSVNAPKNRKIDKQQIIPSYLELLSDIRTKFTKLSNFARSLATRYDNSAEYDLRDYPLQDFLAQLSDSGHFVVVNSDDAEDNSNTYVIASPGLIGKTEMIRGILWSAHNEITAKKSTIKQITLAGPDCSSSNTGITENNAVKIKKIEEEKDWRLDGEDSTITEMADPNYLLLLNLDEEFWWTGNVMTINLGPDRHFNIKSKKVRLVADSPGKRLEASKTTFASLWASPTPNQSENGDMNDLEDSIYFNTTPIVAHQAHIPVVNQQLRKIGRTAYKFALSVVKSVEVVQNHTKGLPGSADLLASWYMYSAAHGVNALKFMERSTYHNFKPIMMRLAIKWVSFISDQCEPSDPKTFKWAVAALEFAQSQTSNSAILSLNEEDYSKLKVKVAQCMTLLMGHFDIMGARSNHEESKRRKERERTTRKRSGSDVKAIPSPLTSLSDDSQIDEDIDFFELAPDRSMRRATDIVSRKIAHIEANRHQIEKDLQLVGRILDTERIEDQSLYHLATAAKQFSIKWQKLEFVGRGTFGSVYRAVNLDTGEQMAVKELRIQEAGNSNSNLYKAIRDEMQVMQVLQHVNIAEYYGIEVHRDRVYIFEEYCAGGSLSGLLEHGKIDDEIVQLYTLQMLEGLSYLHSKNIIHRDIKPDNILLDKYRGVIKYVDFGAAKILAQNNKTIARTRAAARGGAKEPEAQNSLTGTPMYMSPEVIKGEKRGKYGAMDIWSLGCVVLECVTGKRPWSQLDNEWAIMFQIGVATKHPPLPEPGQLSEIGIDFIRQCLTLDPDKRPTAADLADHPWMRQCRDMLAEQPDDGEGSVSMVNESMDDQQISGQLANDEKLMTPPDSAGMTPDQMELLPT